METVISNPKGRLKMHYSSFDIIAIILFVLGLGAWVKQVISGFDGYSNQFPWGIYVAVFFASASGAAGLFGIYGIRNLLKIGNRKEHTSLIICALSLLIVAGCVITADVGAPLGLINIVTSMNFSAAIVADFWVLLICALFAIFVLKKKTNEDSNIVFGCLAVILAIVLLTVEAWLVTKSNNQELLGITMGTAISIIQAAIIGFSFTVLIGLKKTNFFMYGIKVSLLLSLIVQLAELLSGLGNAGRLGLQWTALSNSSIYWVFSIVLGIIVPLIFLYYKKAYVLTGILSIVGVISAKLSFLWASQSVAGIAEMQKSVQPGVSMIEIIVVLGTIALGYLCFSILKNVVIGKGENLDV
ncbi:MAG: hypothetical protein WCR27_07335 [Eubacteriales bacterium]